MGARLTTAIGRLQPRERLVLGGGTVVVALFLISVLIVEPYVAARQAMLSSLNGKRHELVEMAELQQKYRDVAAFSTTFSQKMEERATSFSLFSYIDQRAAAAVIKDRISSMKPFVAEYEGDIREVLVELHMDLINIRELMDFLITVESPVQMVSVKRLAIQQSGVNPDLLDVVMTVSTFESSTRSGQTALPGSKGSPPLSNLP